MYIAINKLTQLNKFDVEQHNRKILGVTVQSENPFLGDISKKKKGLLGSIRPKGHSTVTKRHTSITAARYV